MSDIVERLRRWTHAVDAAPACDLMDEAADEIARLRLTDAEREAVLAMACYCDTRSGLEWVRLSATLRGLLERLAP